MKFLIDICFRTGFFTLDKYGLNLICSCKQSGFHPHPTNPPIYMVSNDLELRDYII